MSKSSEYVARVMETVYRRNDGQPEFLEAVTEVLQSLVPVLELNPKFEANSILERMVEPERGVAFRVAWVDDNN